MSSSKKKDKNADQEEDQPKQATTESPAVVIKEPKFVFKCTPEKERKPHSKKEINQMFKAFFEQTRVKRVAKAKKLVSRRVSRGKASSAMKKLFAQGGEEIDMSAVQAQIQAATTSVGNDAEEEEDVIDEGFDEDGNWIMKTDVEMRQGQKESMVRFMRRKRIPGTKYVMEWVTGEEEQRKTRMGKIDWQSSPVIEVKNTYTSLAREELNKNFKCKARGGADEQEEGEGEGEEEQGAA